MSTKFHDRKTRIFFSILISVTAFIFACENKKAVNNEVLPEKTEIKLSKEAIYEFNKVFSRVNINGVTSNLNSVYSIRPKIDSLFYDNNHLKLYYFFKGVRHHSDTVYFAASKINHCVYMCYKLYNGHIYIDETVLFNLNLKFLNNENGINKFSIIGNNPDTLFKIWETTYDTRLFGNWHLDSIHPNKNASFSKAKNWEFQKPIHTDYEEYQKSEWYLNPPKVMIDSAEYHYRTRGPMLEVLSPKDTLIFTRVSISNSHLILGILHRQQKYHYFFTKRI